MTDCAFCGSEVERHDPVWVEDDETLAFCNWACVREYIDAEGLVGGACCHLDRDA